MSTDLPAGLVTFAFTDVVGSTEAMTEHGDDYVAALRDLRERVSRHAHAVHGVVVETEGDGTLLAFAAADAGVKALCDLQAELEARPTQPVALRLRAGAHTGHAVPVDRGYVALAVHVAARVAGAARSGQVLVSAETYSELTAPVGDPLGAFVLKGVAEPTSLWRVWGDSAPPRATPARRTNVRTPRTSFAGRVRELGELDRAVRAHRLVSVVGPGGAGKTRLVSEWALEEVETRDGTVWLTELATVDSVDQVARAVGQACGTSVDDPGRLAEELAARSSFVLVLDNCEHVVEGAVALVEELLDACPDLRIVCTSREPLLVPGEVVQRLGVLQDADDALTLFVDRAAAAGADVEQLPTATLLQICDALDHMPLAIELGALHAATMRPEQLLASVQRESDLTRRGGDERQRSLEAILDWSVKILPADELDALLSLSIWPGRFDATTAEELLARVPSASIGAVGSLARKNLLDLDGQEYRLLYPVRVAARRRLARQPDLLRTARRALVAWAVDRARQTFGRDVAYHSIPFDQVLAIELAIGHEREEPVDDIYLVWDLARHIARSRHASPALRAEAAGVLAGGPPADLRSALVHGVALNILSAYARPVSLPLPHLEAILEVVRRAGVGGVPLLQTLGAVAWELEITGRAEAALPLRLEFVEVADADPELAWLRPAARHGLANNHRAQRRWFDAAAACKEGLAIGAVQRTVTSMDILHAGLAEALLELGDPRQALAHALEAERLLPVPGHGRDLALRLAATAYWRLGEAEPAHALGRELAEALQQRASAGDRISSSALEALARDVPGVVSLE